MHSRNRVQLLKLQDFHRRLYGLLTLATSALHTGRLNLARSQGFNHPRSSFLDTAVTDEVEGFVSTVSTHAGSNVINPSVVRKCRTVGPDFSMKCRLSMRRKFEASSILGLGRLSGPMTMLVCQPGCIQSFGTTAI